MLAAVAAGLCPLAPAAAGEKGPMLIRDAEVETIIRGYAAPLFTAAGLDPDAVRIYLIQDDRINAFVAGGMNLFLHTGLIIQAENANQLIGVIAHETGHIAGGHLVLGREAMKSASIESLIATILGIGAAIAIGQPGAGAVIGGAGQSMTMATMLTFTREQESAADQAGMTLLDRTHQSARGVASFLHVLQQQEELYGVGQNPYLRTHPLARERIESADEHVRNSPYSDAEESPAILAAHRRMVAKLVGFIEPLERVLQQYPEKDASLEGRYARAIAHYRAADLKQAMFVLDGLIVEYPDDPYFQELKGQILYENSRARDSIPFYRQAVALAPTQPLLRYGLAQSLIALEQPAENKEGLHELEEVVRVEPGMSSAWRLMAVGYGRDNQMAMAALALAEAAEARGDKHTAREQADRALQQLPAGSPAWLRANDILSASSEIE
jgi:predicted Zn-dependent protease